VSRHRIRSTGGTGSTVMSSFWNVRARPPYLAELSLIRSSTMSQPR